jgi:hypothetical protein
MAKLVVPGRGRGRRHLVDAHLDGVLLGAFKREHVVRHRDADGVGVLRPVPQRRGPHRRLHLHPMLQPRRRRRLQLVGELRRGRVLGADADHGQRGAATRQLGAEVEDLAVLGAEQGPRRLDAHAERLAVAEADDVPGVARREVALELVRRAAVEVAAPVGAEDRRVAAGALVSGLHLVPREEGRAAVPVVRAREPDGPQPVGHGAAGGVVRRAAVAALVVAAPAAVGRVVAGSAGDVPRGALQIDDDDTTVREDEEEI